MIAGITESKRITCFMFENIFDMIVNVNLMVQNINLKFNKEFCWWDCKNSIKHYVREKSYFLNPSKFVCENNGYLKSLAITIVK